MKKVIFAVLLSLALTNIALAENRAVKPGQSETFKVQQMLVVTNESSSRGSYEISYKSSGEPQMETIDGFSTRSLRVKSSPVKITNTGKTTLMVSTE